MPGILDYLTKKVGPKANPNDPLWMDLAKTYGLMDESTLPNKSYNPAPPEPALGTNASMRAATGMERFRDTVGSGLNSLSQQPIAKVSDAVGVSNMQGLAEGFNQPAPEVYGAALPFGPGNLAKKFSGGPIARSVANDLKVPKKPGFEDDVDRLLRESGLGGNTKSAQVVDPSTIKFHNNASGDKGGLAGSIEETSALGSRERIIDRGTGPVPLLSGRDIYPSAGQKVGWRNPDGSIQWDTIEPRRKGKM